MSEQPLKKPVFESSLNFKKTVSIEEVVEGGSLSNLINNGLQCLTSAGNITSEYVLINITINAATIETTAGKAKPVVKNPMEILQEKICCEGNQCLRLLKAAVQKRLQDRCNSKRVILNKIQNKRKRNLEELTKNGRNSAYNSLTSRISSKPPISHHIYFDEYTGELLNKKPKTN